MGRSSQDMDIWSDLEAMPLVSLISFISLIIELGYFKVSSIAPFPQPPVQLVRRAAGAGRRMVEALVSQKVSTRRRSQRPSAASRTGHRAACRARLDQAAATAAGVP